MQSTKGWLRFVAVFAVLALVLVACGEGADETTTTTAAAPGETTTTAAEPGDTTTTTEAMMGGGQFSTALSEPPFIDPNLVQDSEGFEVARLMFDGLTLYDPAGGAVVPGVAESWESNDDKTVWTFNLRDDSFFTNGDPVTAESFVYGISRTADPDTGSRVSYHVGPGYADVLGFDDVNGGEGTGTSGDELLEGLVAVDDYTLEITLARSNALLPKIVAHPAFSPIPQAVFEADPAGWNEMPIGNGPYKMQGPWEHDVAIFVERNEDYYGPAGNADVIEFRIYADLATEYRDVQAGNLDIGRIPTEELGNAEAEFGDRYLLINSGSFGYIGLPNTVPPYDNPVLRQALSLAIDREAITERILIGTSPATGFVPPVATGAIQDACEFCTYDPERAKELYEESGGIPGDALVMRFNAGSGHEDWVEAVTTGWSQVLGIEATFEPLEWAAYLDFLFEVGPDGPYRLGWQWDYPSAYNFLAPLYESTSGDNYSLYSNADFDAAMNSAITSLSEEEAIPFLEEGQRIVGDEIPVIPMTYGTERRVWTENVSNVQLNNFGFGLWENVAVGG
jgi:ABC-type transport system substrate-binding protein